MAALDTVEIAIFPIPNMVTFPTATVPLHVFEPRYRKMIMECLAQQRRVGVCHVDKVIRKVEASETLEEALNSNLDTYLPQKIFSAGFCNLKNTTDDGRLHIDVLMDGRYELQNRIQEIPYEIYACLPYTDNSKEGSSTGEKRDRLDRFLLKLAEQKSDESLQALLKSTPWQELTNEDYSHTLFQMVRFDPDIAQTILEMRSVDERLDFACKLLNIEIDQ